jgi:hypothetical protein
LTLDDDLRVLTTFSRCPLDVVFSSSGIETKPAFPDDLAVAADLTTEDAPKGTSAALADILKLVGTEADVVLQSSNGLLFPSHKKFLSASSPFFEFVAQTRHGGG